MGEYINGADIAKKSDMQSAMDRQMAIVNSLLGSHNDPVCNICKQPFDGSPIMNMVPIQNPDVFEYYDKDRGRVKVHRACAVKAIDTYLKLLESDTTITTGKNSVDVKPKNEGK